MEFEKFSSVSHGIWQSVPQNLSKFAAENRGPVHYFLVVLKNTANEVAQMKSSTVELC